MAEAVRLTRQSALTGSGGLTEPMPFNPDFLQFYLRQYVSLFHRASRFHLSIPGGFSHRAEDSQSYLMFRAYVLEALVLPVVCMRVSL